MTPVDLQYLLDSIVNITRAVGELTNLTNDFQAKPSKELLRSLMKKDIELESLLEFFENRLDQIEECELD
jgi:hypothetical protein